MLRQIIAWMAALAVTALVGCGNGVGNEGAIVGGDCVVSGQCSMDSRCLTGERYPGGYCAKTCRGPEDCPAGSECADEAGGICMVSCAAATECRSGEGYGCVERNARGALGTIMVCATP